MSVINVPYPRTMGAHVPHRCTSLNLRESCGILFEIWVSEQLLMQVVQQLPQLNIVNLQKCQADAAAQVYMGETILFFIFRFLLLQM